MFIFYEKLLCDRVSYIVYYTVAMQKKNKKQSRRKKFKGTHFNSLFISHSQNIQINIQHFSAKLMAWFYTGTLKGQ